MGRAMTDDMIQLVLDAQNGNSKSFSKLISLIQNDLYKLAEAQVKNHDDANDVLSQTLLLAYKNIHKLREPLYFKTWIVRILLNECKKFYKRRKKRFELYNKLETSVYSSGTHDDFEKAEMVLDLEKYLNSLSPEDHSCIVLQYCFGYTAREIASILGLTEPAVHCRIDKIKKQIKQSYYGRPPLKNN